MLVAFLLIVSDPCVNLLWETDSSSMIDLFQIGAALFAFVIIMRCVFLLFFPLFLFPRSSLLIRPKTIKIEITEAVVPPK